MKKILVTLLGIILLLVCIGIFLIVNCSSISIIRGTQEIGKVTWVFVIFDFVGLMMPQVTHVKKKNLLVGNIKNLA